ncbi:CynX/NimT family MFS transporter [Alloscardovia omnicolens]|uniref:MFS transporter n=1 Tax=Alloscardovia omnicolens TaxID=419015 RepID=UPI003A70EDD7
MVAHDTLNDVVDDESQHHSLLSVFLMLAGLIMRAPIVVLPLYIDFMAHDMGRDIASFGILTSLPLIMFVIVSMCVPVLVQKINLTHTMQLGTIAIFVGCALRIVMTWNAMIVGTVLVGMGIAILNIAMPTLVSQKFSQQPGLYTMRYCAAIVVGAIVLVLISPYATAHYGWRSMLWIMAAMALLPMLISFFLPRIVVRAADNENSSHLLNVRFLKDIRTWLFIGMFAGQSFLSYTISAWLPSILNAGAVNDLNYTVIMLIFNAMGLPISMGIPFFVARTARRYHVMALAVLTAVQILTISLFPLHSILGTAYWYVFSIIACAFFTTIFVMVLTFYPIKAATPADAADISGISQSFGYLIAAAGPVLYGWMYADAMPGISFAWAMALVVLLNAWCSWHVIRMNRFGLHTVKE